MKLSENKFLVGTVATLVLLLSFVVVQALTINGSPDEINALFGNQNFSSELVFGGTTNFDSLELGETLTVTGATTLATTTVEVFTEGGNLTSTTTDATAVTLKEADLLGKGLYGQGTAGDVTFTLPASSTITAMIPSIGDSKVWYLMPTNTNSWILAAGTGFDLEYASSSAASTPTVYGGHIGKVTFIRMAAINGGVGDIAALFTVGEESD